MHLTTWLEEERGRGDALADRLAVTKSAVSQWKANGVPIVHMQAVEDFTGGAVTLQEMVAHSALAKLDAKAAATEPLPAQAA